MQLYFSLNRFDDEKLEQNAVTMKSTNILRIV